MTRSEFADFVASQTEEALYGKKRKSRENAIRLVAAMALATIFERESWIAKDIDFPAAQTGDQGNSHVIDGELTDTAGPPEVAAGSTAGLTINEDAHGDDSHTSTPAPVLSAPPLYPRKVGRN